MEGATANSISVGLPQIDSVMMCPSDALEGFKQEFIPLQSMRQFRQLEDAIDVVCLLWSQDARWIMGPSSVPLMAGSRLV
jgi:hypothetical protein